jgi:hypothetical protein
MESEMTVKVRQASQKDAGDLLQMMCALWPLANSDELRTENDRHFRHPTNQSFVGRGKSGRRCVAGICRSCPALDSRRL